MTRREVIEFIKEHIVHKFGIPQTLTMDPSYLKRCLNLLDVMVLSCSIHLHIILKAVVNMNIVTRF